MKRADHKRCDPTDLAPVLVSNLLADERKGFSGRKLGLDVSPSRFMDAYSFIARVARFWSELSLL